jgi:YesN/AraC family two-component response regulator
MANAVPVMIVDDEILAVEDLQHLIPWEQHGFEIAATATNSQRALELYRKHHPRILFVDIRMPGMDGLELSRQIKLEGHPVKIILLTAFKDFEYAKRALEIGVANYLLKHDINEASLLRELRRVHSELQNESRQNSILRQQFFRRILFHGETPEDKAGIAGIQPADLLQDHLGLMFIIRNSPFLTDFQAHSPDSIMGMLNPGNMELPEGMDWVEGIDQDGLKSIVIAGMKKTNSHSEERDRLYQLAFQLQRILHESGSDDFSVVIPGTCAGCEEIASLYHKAIRTYPYLIFLGRAQILFAEDLPATIGRNSSSPGIILKKIPQMLREADDPGLQESIRQLFQPVISNWDLDGLQIIGNELLYFLVHYRNEHNLPNLRELFKQAVLDVSGLYSASGLQAWFIEQYRQAFQQVRESAFGNYSKKVKQALQYIHQHYSQDLSVDSVAEVLGISGVYLSQIFKKETGQTFLEYLTEYRIEIAKDLLAKGGYKIYEVAAMVGYKTSQYFSQVFRKVTGMVPLECREGNVHRPGEGGP